MRAPERKSVPHRAQLETVLKPLRSDRPPTMRLDSPFDPTRFKQGTNRKPTCRTCSASATEDAEFRTTSFHVKRCQSLADVERGAAWFHVKHREFAQPSDVSTCFPSELPKHEPFWEERSIPVQQTYGCGYSPHVALPPRIHRGGFR